MNHYLTQLFFNDKDLEPEEILKVITFLNRIADKIRLSKIDLKKQYDRTDIEADNAANDLQ